MDKTKLEKLNQLLVALEKVEEDMKKEEYRDIRVWLVLGFLSLN